MSGVLSSAVTRLAKLIASAYGSVNVGFQHAGANALPRTLQDKARETYSVFETMTLAQIMDATSGATPTLDHTAAVQKAINYCIANNRDLEVPGLCRITAPLMIDRQVDSVAFDSYFTILTKAGGGFYVDTAINIFSSSIVDNVAAVSQLIRWQSLRFVASNNALAAYVIDGTKFLRSSFNDCNFSKIKAAVSTKYVQSIYFINCNARRWSGTFFKAAPQGYDIQVIGGLYEAGSGSCFDILAPIGCKFWTQIEGMDGTALIITGAQGVDISTYFEANGIDIDCRTGGLENQGIKIHGCVMARSNPTFSVKWGKAKGCVSHGNWHTYNMHDLQGDSFVDINDQAQYNVSNTGDAGPHSGYRSGSTAPFVVRGGNSASYTVSNFVCKYSIIGDRIQMEFTCTLTSTATNPADVLYIASGMSNATAAGVMCGNVWVAGSAMNNGISPLNLINAIPARVQSCQQVLPANVAGAAWTIQGQFTYMVAR